MPVKFDKQTIEASRGKTNNILACPGFYPANTMTFLKILARTHKKHQESLP